ncbi:MAG: hypothetical protein HY854_23680 [Burkholderiales bacterium]|nr:hypothetical protein [Burkholderiales bacterium]
MPVKYFAAVVAIVLLLAFLVPIAWKLKEVELAIVLAIGFVMALVDLGQSLRGKEP